MCHFRSGSFQPRVSFRLFGFMSLALMSLVSQVLLGQEHSQANNQNNQDEPRGFLRIGGSFLSGTDLDTTPIDLSTARLNASLGLTLNAGQRWQFDIEGTFQQTTYDLDQPNALAFLGGAGQEDFEYQELSARALYFQSPKRFWFFNLGIAAGTDQEAKLADARLLSASGGMIWRKSDRFMLITGAFFQEELDGDDQLFPFLGFRWQINEHFQLNLDRRLEAVYQPNPDWDLALFVEYQQGNFRYGERASVPNGSLEDDRALVGLGLTHRFSRRMSIEGKAGMTAFGELDVKDASGQSLFRDDFEPGAFASLAFTFKF